MVDEWTLRGLFNDHYLDQVLAGDLDEAVETDGHPSRPAAPVPFCTRSQIVAYRAFDGTRRREVARVHRYVLPTGELGLPDPKSVLVDNTVYRC